MTPPPSIDYLAGYPGELVEPVHRLIARQQLAGVLLKKYPQAHAIRTDKTLYDYVQDLRGNYLRNIPQIAKVAFDGKLQSVGRALGTHTRISRIQGAKLKSKHEIRIATLFREGPAEFLRMIVAHELAHLKSPDHDKSFYQLCRHIEPDYHQIEFEVRAYLCHLAAGGEILWAT